MRFVQKVENFFFPCSKVMHAVKAQHDITMEEFRYQADRLEKLMACDEGQCILSNAFVKKKGASQ